MLRFLLAALQINSILGQTNVDEVRQALETLPCGLSNNLAITIERIKKQHSCPTRSRLAFMVLQWLSMVRRPITTRELQHAIATRPGGTHLGALTDPKFFVDCCFGLTIIDRESSVIRLVHFSVNEYLQERRKELFGEPDSVLAWVCLAYMSIVIEKECNGSTFAGWTAAGALLKLQQWPFWEYAACHWGIHARGSCAGRAGSSLRDFAFDGDSLSCWLDYILFNLQGRFAKSSEWERFASFLAKGATPLHITSIYGLHWAVQECLDTGFDVNHQDGNGATAFMLAAAFGRDDILKLLLSTSALDANMRDERGRTALCYAIENRHINTSRFLLDCPAVEVNAGRSLEIASRYGWMSDLSKSMVQMLLSHANFSLQAQPHEVVIKAIFGLARWEQFDLFRTLLRRPDFQPRGSKLEEQECNLCLDYWGKTDYDINLLKDKLDQMCDIPSLVALVDQTFPNIPDFAAMALLWPFVYYAFYGYPNRRTEVELEVEGSTQSGREVSTEPYVYGIGFWDNASGDIRLRLRDKLVAGGISFASRDSKGRGFLHAVCGMREIGPWYHPYIRMDCVRFLLQTGAQVTLKDNTGRTPLHYAAANGNEDIVRELISAGADPLASDSDGWTVLHSAAISTSMDVVTLLVDLGAVVDSTTASGESVLHAVAEYSQDPRPMIEYLVGKGGRLDVKNSDGLTPGFLSVWGKPEALEAFLGLGDDPFAQDPFGNSMLLNCVWMMAARETSLCLSLGSSEVDIGLKAVGYFGMSALDFLSQFDRSVAAKLGFTDHHWSNYTPTPPNTRQKHMRKLLLYRIDKMLTSDNQSRLDMCEKGSHQLLELGDEQGAAIMLEQLLAPESRASAMPFSRDIRCSSCQANSAPLFKCRTCPWVAFCGGCRDSIPRNHGSYMDAIHCRGHKFLEVPGRHWKNLHEGKVNPEGQTFEEFLEGLKQRIALEIDGMN